MFPVSGKFTTIFAGSSPQNRVARSFRQLRRFPHFINADKVFGTHSQADVYWLNAQREILTTSLEGSSTTHMDLVSATLKPVKKVKVTRSGNSKTRAA